MLNVPDVNKVAWRSSFEVSPYIADTHNKITLPSKMPLPSIPPVTERPNLAVEKKSKTAGRGLFAKDNINAGDEILIEERPLVSAIDKELRYDICSWCFMTHGESHIQTGQEDPNIQVNRCSGCHVLAYCSKVSYPSTVL